MTQDFLKIMKLLIDGDIESNPSQSQRHSSKSPGRPWESQRLKGPQKKHILLF